MNTPHQKRLQGLLTAVVPFNQAELDAASRHFTFNTYEPKEYIFFCGDIVHQVHFVIDGIGRYFYIDKEGQERNKSLVRKGGAFASLNSLVEGDPSPFFAQSITRCVTASIEYERLIELSGNHLNWSEFIRKILERLVLKKEQREAGFLLLTAKERYQQFLTEFGEESQQIPLRHVAMYIGIADVSLSRIRKEMGLT